MNSEKNFFYRTSELQRKQLCTKSAAAYPSGMQIIIFVGQRIIARSEINK